MNEAILDVDSANCGLCGGELESGEAAIEGTFTGFLFFGMSYQRLVFKPATSNSSSELLNTMRRRRAYRCKTCQAFVLPAER